MKKWSRNFAGSAPRLSVVMAVYNKPRELGLCLEGYRRQSALGRDPRAFHLILADDGSRPEIEAAFARFAAQAPFPVTYLRQEDAGWGKLRMLNWATLEALADWVVFTDGDCVPHGHFVRAHIAHRREDAAGCGRRVDLMEKISATLSERDVREGRLDSPLWMLRAVARGEVDYGEQGLYFPGWLSRTVEFFSTNSRPTILGSNFCIHKKWLRAVNGFDESFQSPGLGEDTDLERRLQLAGARLEWVTHRAVQFHVWHPLTQVGEQSRKTYELHSRQGNREARVGLREFPFSSVSGLT